MKFFALAAFAAVSAESTEFKPTEFKINTFSWGSEITWKAVNANGAAACSGGPYSSRTEYDVECQLEAGTYTLECHDSYGDGWHGGYITIDGKEFCKDFRSGEL
tara:strand:- start:195 stop:506 length:312 start_codon:yes stop_codon:yes gene_type:complete